MSLTIVMYHYVRRPERTPYPGIKALHTDAFAAQLAHIVRHYQPVTGADLMRAVAGETTLPERAILLTFDDGYRDCVTDVAPLLRQHGLRGCFFPVSGAVRDHTVLDVNKIQFLLAAVPVDTLLGALRAELADWQDLWTRHAKPNRWDSAEVRFVKNLLQHGLPPEHRARITAELFRSYITEDEASFSRGLYCQEEDLRALLDEGHSLGCHGYRHLWLNHCTPREQETEISEGLRFLRALGVEGDWMIAYPFGGVDPSLPPKLRAKGCRLGFTVENRRAEFRRDDPLLFPRLDANDLPPQRPVDDR